MSKEIAIAILNWNGKHLLEEYLPGVILDSPEADIFVIDNASTDDSVQWMQENHPDVAIIELKKNGGYAGGYNEGLQFIHHEFVVLMNSDIATSPGWLVPILTALKNNPKIGACQPIIRADKRRTHFEYAGAAGGYMDKLGYAFCRGRIFDTLEEDQGQYNTTESIFWATGACLVVRNEAFKNSGQLDTELFAHMEEIDLCWRMQLKGWEIKVINNSCVYHLGGATLDSASPHKTYLNFRNNLCILLKNLPLNRVLTVVFTRLFLDGLAGIQFMLKGKFDHTWAIVRAHFAFYSMYGSMMKKRSTNTQWPITGVYNRSIIFDYFIQKRKKFSELPVDAFHS